MAAAGRKGQVADLLVSLRTDLGQLRTDVAEVQRTFDKGFSGVQRSAENAGRQITQSFRTMARGIGAIVGGVSLAGLIRQTVALGDQLKNMSERTKLSIEFLGGLRKIAATSGTDLGQLALAIQRSQRELGAMEAGGKGASEMLQRMGLNIRELQQGTAEDFFLKVSRALGDIRNEFERNAAGAKIFGRQWDEVKVAILAAARDGFQPMNKELADAYKRLGDLKDQSVLFANKFVDAMARSLAGWQQFMSAMFNPTERQKVINELDQVAGRIIELTQLIKNAEAQRAGAPGLFGPQIESWKKELDSLSPRLDDLTNKLRELNKPAAAAPAGGGGPLGGLLSQETKRGVVDLTGDVKLLEAGEEEVAKASQLLLEIFARLDREGATPLAAALSDINLEFDDLLKKLAAAGTATGVDVSGAVAQLEFHRRQRLLAVTSPQTGADFLDASAGDAMREIDSRAQDLQTTMDRLRDRMSQITGESAVFGASFNDNAARISALKDTIRELIAQGLDPMDSRIQRMMEQLNELEAVVSDTGQGLDGLFKSIGNNIESALSGIMAGTRSWADAMQQIFAQILADMAAMIAEMLVLEGVKLAIQAFTGASGGGSVPAAEKGGAVPQGLEWRKAPHLNTGGAVPIIAHEGEYVVKADSVRKLGLDRMNFINRMGQLPQFEFGGPIRGPSIPRMSFATGGMVSGVQGGAQARSINIEYLDARGAERGVKTEIFRAIREAEDRAVLRSAADTVDRSRRGGRFSRSIKGD